MDYFVIREIRDFSLAQTSWYSRALNSSICVSRMYFICSSTLRTLDIGHRFPTGNKNNKKINKDLIISRSWRFMFYAWTHILFFYTNQFSYTTTIRIRSGHDWIIETSVAWSVRSTSCPLTDRITSPFFKDNKNKTMRVFRSGWIARWNMNPWQITYFTKFKNLDSHGKICHERSASFLTKW